MNPVRSILRNTALLLFTFAATFAVARAQQAAPAPQAPATQVEKLPLYVSVNSPDEDKLGAQFGAAFVAKLKGVDSLTVTESDPGVDAPTATVFHVLSVKSLTGDSAVVTIVVLRHTKGFPNVVYVGAAVLPITPESLDDDVNTYFAYLGGIFSSVEVSGEYDQTGTPTAPQQ